MDSRNFPSRRQQIASCLVGCVIMFLGGTNCSGSDGLADRSESESSTLGRPVTTEEVPAVAQQAYESSVAAFQTGNFESARYGFAGIVESVPFWGRARLDLARSLAQLGEVEEAAKQLAVVLRADLYGYLDEVRNVIALHNVLGVEEKISRLQRRWQEAVADGWPIIEFRAAPELAEGEPPEYYPKHRVRAGVFLPHTQRFLPIGRSTPNASALLVDGDTRRVLSIWADATVDLFSLMLNVSWRVEQWLPDTPSAEVLGSPDEDDATFAAMDFSLAPGPTLRRTAEEFEDIPAMLSDADSERGMFLRVVGEGSFLISPPSQGVSLSGNRLVLSQGRTVQLSRNHAASRDHSFVEHEGGLYVLTTVYGCDPSDPSIPPVPVHRHVVDHVNLSTSVVTQISEGSGGSSAMVLPDGRLAIQRGHRVDVLAMGEPGFENAQRLPEGLVLHVPLRKKNCVYH